MVKRLVVLDTETTGRTVSDGHRLLEVGCVELMDRRRTGRNFHRRINPCRQIDAEAIAVRGIRDADAEIGRASCRERGCTYVEISGVGVALKKKTQTARNT